MGWDKNVDYVYMYGRILRHFHSRLREGRVSACYDAVLLLQLRNGLRVGEAVAAFKQFLRDRRAELYVRVEKRRDNKARLVVVPVELLASDVSVCGWMLDVDDVVLNRRLRVYARSTYLVNTHSLRYSFVSYLLRLGVDPAHVSRALGHKNLQTLLNYTSEKESEEILRALR